MNEFYAVQAFDLSGHDKTAVETSGNAPCSVAAVNVDDARGNRIASIVDFQEPQVCIARSLVIRAGDHQ